MPCNLSLMLWCVWVSLQWAGKGGIARTREPTGLHFSPSLDSEYSDYRTLAIRVASCTELNLESF